MDDRGVDRCAGNAQRRVRELFGVRSIEELQHAGVQVRRAFFVDGNGNDLPLVSFERDPAQGPHVTVYVLAPDGADATHIVQMTIPVSLETWNTVLSRSRFFERRLTADAYAGGCLHQWVVTVEAADQLNEFGSPTDQPVRRRTQVACADGLAFDYAMELARLARLSIPHCAALNDTAGRGDEPLLSRCALFSGDKIAAAEVMNQFATLRQGPVTTSDVIEVFNESIAIEWAGEASARGLDQAISLWSRMFDRRWFIPTRLVGVGPNEVRVEGFVRSIANEDPLRFHMAPATQNWTRENGFGFRIRRMQVRAPE